MFFLFVTLQVRKETQKISQLTSKNLAKNLQVTKFVPKKSADVK